ncbi:MAG: hypothetical protein JSV00_10500 [bacterium]|nr:MAG: hypothetical protein JSV00_10500 [bacterium]
METAGIRRLLRLAMFLMAVGGAVLHQRYHPSLGAFEGQGGAAFANSVAMVLSLADVVHVTWLFSRKSTASWGYLVNGLIVIFGTVIMVHFGLTRTYVPGSPLYRHLLIPTTPYILLAWADFSLGAVLYRLWFAESEPRKKTPAAAPGVVAGDEAAS